MATEALAYLVESSNSVRHGMMKLLRGLVDVPDLRFKTQQAVQKENGSIRPDMWGFDLTAPRVFVENKFWAGLTDNQPVPYLRQLAICPQPSILLVVAPAAREHTLWRELQRRLHENDIAFSEHGAAAGVFSSVATQLGPILALTSWANVLSALEHETVDEPSVRADLVQLRALCDAADSDAFTPVSGEELSNQRIPALLLQLSAVVKTAVELAVSREILDLGGTTQQSSSERIGRYSYFGGHVEGNERPGAWLGIHLRLWKKHGATPLWAVFHSTKWGQASMAEALLAQWASDNNVPTFNDEDGSFVVALEIPAREEKSVVVETIVNRLQQMRDCLNSRRDQKTPAATNE